MQLGQAYSGTLYFCPFIGPTVLFFPLTSLHAHSALKNRVRSAKWKNGRNARSWEKIPVKRYWLRIQLRYSDTPGNFFPQLGLCVNGVELFPVLSVHWINVKIKKNRLDLLCKAHIWQNISTLIFTGWRYVIKLYQ